MDTLNDKTPEIAPVTAVRLVVALYDGAIAALRAAVTAIDRNDSEERLKAIHMASDIISQLYLALDLEKGGDIACNLGRLYGYMLSQLRQVNLTNDPLPAREIIELLYHLQLSWRELDVLISCGESPETGKPDAPEQTPRING